MRLITRLFVSLSCALSSGLFAQEYYGVQVETQNLGQGFDSEQRLFRSHCVTGDWVETGNTKAELSYLGSNTLERYLQETFGKVKGGVNLIIFAGSVSTSLSSQVTETTQTATSNIKLIYDAKDVSLENRVLTPLGQTMQQQDAITIDATCGDSFVHHVKLGAELFVTARLHFRSVEEYQKWVTKIKVRFLFYSKTKTKTKEWYDLTENAVYSIDVNARSGMTPRLRQLLNSNPTYCKSSSMDGCLDTGAKIFDYLFSPTGYAQDIRNSPPQVLSFSTETYVASGHFGLDVPYVNKGTAYALEEERLNVKLYKNQQIRDALYAFAQVEEDETLKQSYLAKVQLADENIGFLDDAANTCRMSSVLIDCQQAVNQAYQQLHWIDY